MWKLEIGLSIRTVQYNIYIQWQKVNSQQWPIYQRGWQCYYYFLCGEYFLFWNAFVTGVHPANQIVFEAWINFVSVFCQLQIIIWLHPGKPVLPSPQAKSQ